MKKLSAVVLIAFMGAGFLSARAVGPVSGTGNLPARPGKDYALLFAVSDYAELDDLTFPIQNAEEIANELRERYGFETEVVKNPTLEQIYNKIDDYRNKRYPDDAQLLVFFSGHGQYDEATKIGFFCPKDAKKNDRTRRSYFEYPILTREVYSIRCNHILLALDACYSGSLDDRLIPKSSEWNRPKGNQISELDQFVKDKLQYKSRLCITSGLLEPTPDNSDFAARLLIALRTNSNPVLTFDGLNSTLEFARPKPRHGRLDGDTGGDFVFVPEMKLIKETPNLNKAVTPSNRLRIFEPNSTLPKVEEYKYKIAGKWMKSNGLDLGDFDTYDFTYTYSYLTDGGVVTIDKSRKTRTTGRVGHEQEGRWLIRKTNYYGSWDCIGDKLKLIYQRKQDQATEGPMITENYTVSFEGDETLLLESATGEVLRLTRMKE